MIFIYSIFKVFFREICISFFAETYDVLAICRNKLSICSKRFLNNKNTADHLRIRRPVRASLLFNIKERIPILIDCDVIKISCMSLLVFSYIGHFHIVSCSGILFPSSFGDRGNLALLVEPVFNQIVSQLVSFLPVISPDVAFSSCDKPLLKLFQFSASLFNLCNQIFEILIFQI